MNPFNRTRSEFKLHAVQLVTQFDAEGAKAFPGNGHRSLIESEVE